MNIAAKHHVAHIAAQIPKTITLLWLFGLVLNMYAHTGQAQMTRPQWVLILTIIDRRTGARLAPCPISEAALFNSDSRRPVMKTRAPSSANRFALPKPMPALPPVTNATLPSSFLLI